MNQPPFLLSISKAIHATVMKAITYLINVDPAILLTSHPYCHISQWLLHLVATAGSRW